MEVKDQPNQTDPSEVAPSSESAIKERLAKVMEESKTTDNPIVENPVTQQPVGGGSGSEVPSPKDSTTVTDPSVEVLKLVEGTLGRKFNSVDEVKQTLANLNSLVGDQAIAKARESAKLYDTFVGKFATEQGVTVDEAKKFWAETLAQGTVQQPKPQSKTEPVEDKRLEELSAEVETLKGISQRNELLSKYPYAGTVADEIAIVAKQKGISQLEAFEQSPLKPLAELKAKDESQKNPVVTPSSRIGFDTKKVQQLGARVLARGEESDKIALTQEVLGDLVK